MLTLALESSSDSHHMQWTYMTRANFVPKIVKQPIGIAGALMTGLACEQECMVSSY